MTQYHLALDGISKACSEIQQVLNEHLNRTSNSQYKTDISKDLVTLYNLQHIVEAVRQDIDSGKVGASTELLLRIAANDFKDKLKMIPDKRSTCKEIVHDLQIIHKKILQMTTKAN